jgi:hypothetical protein
MVAARDEFFFRLGHHQLAAAASQLVHPGKQLRSISVPSGFVSTVTWISR